MPTTSFLEATSMSFSNPPVTFIRVWYHLYPLGVLLLLLFFFLCVYTVIESVYCLCLV